MSEREEVPSPSKSKAKEGKVKSYRKSSVFVLIGILGYLIMCRLELQSDFVVIREGEAGSNNNDELLVSNGVRSKKNTGSKKHYKTQGYEPLLSKGDATQIRIGRDPDDDAEEDDNEEIEIRIDEEHEPYLNRWQRRFASSQERNMKGGYLFFRHIRKAGGTSLRSYFRDVLSYHNISRTTDDWRAVKKKDPDNYQIHYIEQEFQPMDWQCPNVDPRWRESLRIIVLRHPIERHLSEFFFSGAGSKFAPIDKSKLYVDKAYTDELAEFMSKEVPKWMKGIGIRQTRGDDGLEGKFNMIFGRFYTDNFQLRALAGCSSGDCLKEKQEVTVITEDQMENITKFHPDAYSYSKPVPRCTQYFRKKDAPNLFEQCAKSGHVRAECSIGCDGPCFYPSVAWGEMGRKDLERAVTALKSFDAVLLMKKLDDENQADFLSDIMGVPRDADFSLVKRSDISHNTGVEKTSNREKTHFYRDLLVKLKLRSVYQALSEENKLENEFFRYAEKLNEMMINQWKGENS